MKIEIGSSLECAGADAVGAYALRPVVHCDVAGKVYDAGLTGCFGNVRRGATYSGYLSV